jgi:translation initiation factor 1
LGGLGPALEKLNAPLSENPSSSTPIPNEPVWKMGRVLLRRETAHRGGKTVVVVYDFATHLPISVIEKVAKKLRAACSTGGTVRDRTIEIQGDQVAKVRATLEAEGFAVGGVR